MATEIAHPLHQITPTEASNEILMELLNTAYKDIDAEVDAYVEKVEKTGEEPTDAGKQAVRQKAEAWNKKVEEGFKKLFGYDYPGKGKVKAMALYGPPGHGKSAAYRSAGMTFAKLMGLNFHEDPPADFVPDPDKDFVMITLEMAGEVSNQTVGGIPSKSIMLDNDGNEHAVMDKLVQRQFLMLQGAASGILLLDDFNNASHNVQNMLLPIAQYRRFQTTKFGNCYVGFTGNLGAADGTQVFNPKLALKSRMRQMYCEDTPEDFILRADRSYANRPEAFARAKDIVTAFLETNKDKFAGNPAHQSVEEGDTYNTPRTWEALIEDLGMRLGRFDGKSAGSSALAAQGIAHEVVGSVVAQDFGQFFYQMMTSALPLAKELIENGKLSEASERKLTESIGSSINSEEQGFSEQFAFALANVTGDKLLQAEKLKGEKKEDAMNKIGRAYFIGIERIEASHQNLSITRLRARVENVIGDMLEKTNVNERGNKIWAGLAKGMGAQMGEIGLNKEERDGFRDLLARTLGKRDALAGDKLNVD